MAIIVITDGVITTILVTSGMCGPGVHRVHPSGFLIHAPMTAQGAQSVGPAWAGETFLLMYGLLSAKLADPELS